MNKAIPITLDVGAIELTPEEIVALRKEEKITFARPHHFEATLRIHGYPWAMGEITINETEVVLTIKKIPVIEEAAPLL